jgi:hypothetical protein
MYELYCEVSGDRENNKYWDIFLYKDGIKIIDEGFYNKKDCEERVNELEMIYDISCEWI